MANEELIALLRNLQGSGTGGLLSPGALAQWPALFDTTAGPRQSAGASGHNPLVSRIGNIAGGGVTLLPVVNTLLKLFGVGKTTNELPALDTFSLPAPIRTEAGLSASGETFLIDRGAGNRIRPLSAAPSGSRANELVPNSRNQPEPRGEGMSVTVNVQAMDSQSFLDRREDIARAVREAMLQSHSLNDVVSEL